MRNQKGVPKVRPVCRSHIILGLCYSRMGDIENAEKSLRDALECGKKNSFQDLLCIIYSNLALVKIQQRQLKEAESFSKDALDFTENTHTKNSRQYCDCVKIQMTIYLRSNDITRAERLLKLNEHLFSEQELVLYKSGFLFAMGLPQEAKVILEEFKKRSIDSMHSGALNLEVPVFRKVNERENVPTVGDKSNNESGSIDKENDSEGTPHPQSGVSGVHTNSHMVALLSAEVQYNLSVMSSLLKDKQNAKYSAMVQRSASSGSSAMDEEMAEMKEMLIAEDAKIDEYIRGAQAILDQDLLQVEAPVGGPAVSQKADKMPSRDYITSDSRVVSMSAMSHILAVKAEKALLKCVFDAGVRVQMGHRIHITEARRHLIHHVLGPVNEALTESVSALVADIDEEGEVSEVSTIRSKAPSFSAVDAHDVSQFNDVFFAIENNEDAGTSPESGEVDEVVASLATEKVSAVLNNDAQAQVEESLAGPLCSESVAGSSAMGSRAENATMPQSQQTGKASGDTDELNIELDLARECVTNYKSLLRVARGQCGVVEKQMSVLLEERYDLSVPVPELVKLARERDGQSLGEELNSQRSKKELIERKKTALFWQPRYEACSLKAEILPLATRIAPDEAQFWLQWSAAALKGWGYGLMGHPGSWGIDAPYDFLREIRSKIISITSPELGTQLVLAAAVSKLSMQLGLKRECELNIVKFENAAKESGDFMYQALSRRFRLDFEEVFLLTVIPSPPLPSPTLPYPTLPYSTLPYSTLLYSTLPYPTLPYPTLRCT